GFNGARVQHLPEPAHLPGDQADIEEHHGGHDGAGCLVHTQESERPVRSKQRAEGDTHDDGGQHEGHQGDRAQHGSPRKIRAVENIGRGDAEDHGSDSTKYGHGERVADDFPGARRGQDVTESAEVQRSGVVQDSAQQHGANRPRKEDGEEGDDGDQWHAPSEAQCHELAFSYSSVQVFNHASRFSATSVRSAVSGSSARSACWSQASGRATASSTGYMYISSGSEVWNSVSNMKSMNALAPSGLAALSSTAAYSTCSVQVPNAEEVRPSSADGEEE